MHVSTRSMSVRKTRAARMGWLCGCARLGVQHVMRHEAYDPVTFEPFPPALRRPRCASRLHARPLRGIREDGGVVVWCSDGVPLAHPMSCLFFELCVLF